jgi:peptide/nickel transport system substrate-binding protein
MTRYRKRRLVVVVAVLAVGAIFGAAAAQSRPESSSAAGRTTPAGAISCKATKGTITYGISGAGITALDPNTISFAGQEPLQTLLYDGLTAYDKHMHVVSDLATSWSSSKNLMAWTFQLRHGVHYANGRLFTAADARSNIMRVLDPTVASQAQGQISDIKSVRTVGKYRLAVQLSHPNALLPTALVDVKMSDTTDIPNLNKTGNGTGPYKVANFVPGQNLTLVPNTHWWGGKSCLAQINFLREPDPTSMVTDFRSGKLNLIWQVPPGSVPAAHVTGSFFLTPPTVSGAHVWEVDTTSPPFNDVRARQALSYAIDRPTMVKTALFGLGTGSDANVIISKHSYAYDKSLKPYSFELSKAKQLFTAADVAPGTTFTFWALAGRRDEWITMAQILQQDLQQIGYKLNIVRSDVSTWLAKFYPAGKSYPGYIIGNYFSLPPDPSYAFSQVQYGSCECNWKNPRFEALAQKAVATANPNARAKIYEQMQQIESQDSPIMVIAHQTNIVAVQGGVVGAWEDAQGNVHLEGARAT